MSLLYTSTGAKIDGENMTMMFSLKRYRHMVISNHKRKPRVSLLRSNLYIYLKSLFELIKSNDL